MPAEFVWLTAEVVIDLNIFHTSKTGEPFLLKHSDYLEGAIMRPQNAFHYENTDDLTALSVIYMEGIGRAHAFEQANKRTAYDSGILFLQDNGYDISASANIAETAELFEKLITYDIERAQFEDYLYNYIIEYNP